MSNKSTAIWPIAKKLILLSISILILVFLYWKLDVNPRTFTEIQYWPYLVVAILFPLTVIPFISANRWKLFLHTLHIEESIFTLAKINFISIFQGIVLPSSQGQDVFRVYYIEKKHPEARGKAGSTILIERMIGFINLCLLSLCFSLFIDIPNKSQVILIISLITLAVFLAIALLLNKRLQNYLSGRNFKNKYVNMIYSYCDQFYFSLIHYPYRKVLLSSMIIICLYQLASIVVVYLVFKAYGADMPLYIHIAIYPIISILAMVPITISGLGLREGFFTYFYSFLGVPPDIAISVSLMNYLIIVVEPALLGSVLYIIDLIKNK